MSLDFTLLFKISVLLMQAGSRESTLSFECQLFINFSAINHNFIQKLYMAENNTHLLHTHTSGSLDCKFSFCTNILHF